MGQFVTNVPISMPIDIGVPVHYSMGGFGWNADHGLFIPMDGSDRDITFELPPDEQEMVS